MSEIIIGKHTLESLTSGMYSDPYVVFREYIQNAVDSIDEAIKQAIVTKGAERIDIHIIPAEKQIIIEDNGIGISVNNAEKTLISIGNSKKRSDKSRGFRGIGRLSALSYCSKLIFETCALEEKIGTRIEIDALKLATLLSETTDDDISVIEVIQKVYQFETYSETNQSHYFRVIMKDVDEASGLLSIADVEEYLTQNIPVPYHPDFTWGKEINKRLRAEKHYEPIYNIYLTFGNITKPVYKPYRDEFLVDKSKNIYDKINDISIIKIQQLDGTISAVGWIAKTNYLGSICDKTIKGIRIRKGNILIGDSQTMNTIFKDARFNGWSIGELFAIDPKLIPNARRDNFEKNPTYFLLYEQLMTIASGIVKDIRNASLSRNKELSKAMEKAETIKELTNDALDNGVSLSQKQQIRQQLYSTKESIATTASNNSFDIVNKEIAFDELDLLIGNLNGATAYKALNVASNLSKSERKTLEKVFDVLTKRLGADAEYLFSEIIDEFTKNKLE